MAIPNFPTFFLPRPFADNGTYEIIPDSKKALGRASFKEGFPSETQSPLSNGGIAPSRPDFNGALHMLSAMLFWQQSGGLWIYKTTIDYNTPSVVFYNGNLWFCKSPNGPSTTIPGVVTPGKNTTYWVSFLDFISGSQASEDESGAFVPVGAIMTFPVKTPPKGYLTCNGEAFSSSKYPKLYALLGKATVPDTEGLYVRGYDPKGKNDPDGKTRNILSVQGDAIRNITGSFYTDRHATPSSGIFKDGGVVGKKSGSGTGNGHLVTFDASTQVPTATETRAKNISLLICIKHD